VDLRGYTVREAKEIAAVKVREAWRNGYSQITLLHGGGYARHHLQAAASAAGGVKWCLRGCLARGEWDRCVFPRRSARHEVGAVAMTLAVRKNPASNATEVWEPLPRGYHQWRRETVLGVAA
jgi:hypothetical protein